MDIDKSIRILSTIENEIKKLNKEYEKVKQKNIMLEEALNISNNKFQELQKKIDKKNKKKRSKFLYFF